MRLRKMKNLPELRLIHSDETMEKGIARFSLAFWRKKTNAEIIESLKTEKPEGLKIKADGRIINGNVRCKVLLERNFDIKQLDFEVIDYER